MTTALDARPTPAPAALARFGPQDVQLIKDTICKGATDQELKLFLAVCKRTGLDPFARQIHAVKRRAQDEHGNWVDTMAIQVGIDGYRLVADRTGKYEGQLGPFWSDGRLHPVYDAAGNQTGEALRWLDAWPFPEPPALARVGVLRAGFREPVWAVGRYASYVQTKKGGGPNRMWATMPDLMLAKCVEALAIRKAFPQELSGVYSQEEMGQADRDDEPAPRAIAAGRTAPAGDPERFALASTAIGGAGDLPGLQKVWGQVYADKGRFSAAEWAALEKLKDKRKESLAAAAGPKPAAAAPPADAVERVWDAVRDLDDLAGADEVDGHLRERGLDRAALSGLPADRAAGLLADLTAWLAEARQAAAAA